MQNNAQAKGEREVSTVCINQLYLLFKQTFVSVAKIVPWRAIRSNHFSKAILNTVKVSLETVETFDSYKQSALIPEMRMFQAKQKLLIF